MDAIVLLKEDHKIVEKLFRQFEQAGPKARKEKQKVVGKIIEELTTHAYIEETIFYPAGRSGAPDTADHVLESVQEHHVVVWMLSELRNLDPADERYDAKVTVLMENVRHHVEEEEQDRFPKVREAMGRNRLQQLGEQMPRPRPTPLATRSTFPAPISNAGHEGAALRRQPRGPTSSERKPGTTAWKKWPAPQPPSRLCRAGRFSSHYRR